MYLMKPEGYYENHENDWSTESFQETLEVRVTATLKRWLWTIGPRYRIPTSFDHFQGVAKR